MQPENHWKNNLKKRSNHIVWLSACFLAVLVIATVSVVGSCLYRYAHQSDCQISLYEGETQEKTENNAYAISQKSANPVVMSRAQKYTGTEAKNQASQSAFEVNDAEQVWKTETAVELFQTEYKNAEGVVSVKSADGRKVVAPGTEGSYTFSLKNTSDTAAEYKIWVEASLSSNVTGAPIQTRMASDNGWLLGDKATWEAADALDGVTTSDTIDAGKASEYTIYWQWPFEQGNDVADTGLGDASVEQAMSYTVTIYTMTTTATGEGSQNALKQLVHAVKTGDAAPVFIWAMVGVVSAGVLIGLLMLKKRKNDEKNAHNEIR